MATSSGPSRPYYENLADGEIRLLYVLPDHDDGSLTYELKKVKVEEEPKYFALSYCWGTDEKSKVIKCYHGEECYNHLVTPSLFEFLMQLRSRGEVKALWADQVCIDQENNQEKTTQVMLMKNIYHRAVTVFAWLGTADESAEIAFGFLSELNKGLSTLSAAILDREADDLGDLADLLKIDDDAWEDVRELIQRPYFFRLWIFQEISVAEEVVILCGDKSLTWMDIYTPVFFVRFYEQKKQVFHDRIDSISQDFVRILHRARAFWELKRSEEVDQEVEDYIEMELLNVVSALHFSECSDPRDKIYGLLGVASDGDIVPCRPEYTHSVQEAFARVTRAFIARYSDLAVFNLINILPDPRRTAQDSCSQFPSWIPDYQNGGLQQFNMESNAGWAFGHGINRTYYASGGTRTTLSQYDNTLELTLSAVFVGEITEMLDPALNFERGDALLDSKLWPGGAWSKFLFAQCKEGIYPLTGETEADAYNRMLHADLFMNEPTQTRHIRLRKREHRASPELGSWCYGSSDLEVDSLQGMDGGLIAMGSTNFKRIFATESGLVGYSHASAQPGDQVWIPMGFDKLIVLRKLSTGNWEHKGEAYVHGIMNGEWLLRTAKEPGWKMADEDDEGWKECWRWLDSLSEEPWPFETEKVVIV